MVKINGITINTLDFIPNKQGDLVYYEGPLLSHYIGDNGRQYFFKWVDSNFNLNRWLVFNVDNNNLLSFFNKKISLKELIYQSSPNLVYFIDINDDIEIVNVIIQNTEGIPTTYLPPTNSYYDETEYETYAQLLSKKLST